MRLSRVQGKRPKGPVAQASYNIGLDGRSGTVCRGRHRAPDLLGAVLRGLARTARDGFVILWPRWVLDERQDCPSWLNVR